MRNLLIMAVWGCLAVNAVADDPGHAAVGCFERIERKVSAGDTISVFTMDGVVIRGRFPSIMSDSSTMYLRSFTGSGDAERIMIPIARIQKITYSKRSRIFSVLGFGVGVVAGAFTGIALAPEPEGFLDFSAIGCALVGAFFGGVIGAGGGAEIDKRFTIMVRLRCD